jgi:hypothetical protein
VTIKLTFASGRELEVTPEELAQMREIAAKVA